MKSYEFLREDDDSSKTQPYKVQRGDTLSKIADAHGTTVDAIMALNKGKIIDQNKIYTDDIIKIPSDTAYPGGRGKRQGADSITPDPTVKSDSKPKDQPDAPAAPHPVGTVVKPDWSTTPYRDLGPLIKKPDGSWYTLDGKNRAADEKIIAMAEKIPPVSMPNDNMGGDNFGIADKGWDAPSGSKSSSSKDRRTPGGKPDDIKLPNRPDQLRNEKTDISPIPDAWMTDRFGSSRALGRHHQGIDLHADIGTPVLAPNNGKVLDVGYGATTGTYITLGDMQGNKAHRFMHLSKTLVDQGDTVRQGQVIAKSGNSGFSETTNKAYPPHLHWEKFVNGEPVDPSKFVRLPVKP